MTTVHENTKEGLIRMGCDSWEHTYKVTGCDERAGHLLCERLGLSSPAMAEESTQLQVLVYLSAARWADQAFPTVVMGEKYCAALLATDITDEVLYDIQPPWKAFCITVPNGTVQIASLSKRQQLAVTHILVWVVTNPTNTHVWHWTAFSKTSCITRSGTAQDLLHSMEFSDGAREKYHEAALDEYMTQDERLSVLISRLVLNTALALTTPDNVKEIGSSHDRFRARQVKGNRSGPPEQRVFQIGKPIQLDCRAAVREYLAGTRKISKLSTQTLVRGFWRNQPYGPRNSLRRRQWIEPYWKGPEDAPINVRPHRIGTADESLPKAV